MANPDWGEKRECQECQARFYDLKRDPITCPKCEAVIRIEPPKRVRPAARKRAEEAPKETAIAKIASDVEKSEEDLADDELVEVESDGSEDSEGGEEAGENDLVEDTSELGQGEDVSKAVDQKPDEAAAEG